MVALKRASLRAGRIGTHSRESPGRLQISTLGDESCTIPANKKTTGQVHSAGQLQPVVFSLDFFSFPSAPLSPSAQSAPFHFYLEWEAPAALAAVNSLCGSRYHRARY